MRNLHLKLVFLGIVIGVLLSYLTIAILVKTVERHQNNVGNGTICNIDLKVRVNKEDDKLDIINYRVVECL